MDVIEHIVIEHCLSIVDLPIEHGVHSFLYVYQRVNIIGKPHDLAGKNHVFLWFRFFNQAIDHMNEMTW